MVNESVSGEVVVDGGRGRTVKYAVVSESTAADNEVVAAVAGKKIRVLSYALSAAGAVTVTWKTAATALTGAMSLATGTPLVCIEPQGCFETVAGEALNIAPGGAVQVSGHIAYIEV